MKLNAMFIGGALALALTMSAQAQAQSPKPAPTPAPAASGQALTGSNVDEILNAARGYGSATLATQSNGDPQITGKVNGITYQIYFRNCTDNKNCEDLNFYLGFLDLKPKMEVINDWNMNKRFSRAYLDHDQDAVVEMDLDMVKGISPEYLDSQIGLWTLVVGQFADHVGYKK